MKRVALLVALTCACGGPTRGRDPDIFVEPQSAVVFGRVLVGESARVPVIVRNVGNGALAVSGVALSGGAGSPFTVEAPAVPFTLQPGEARSFDVVYAPFAEASTIDLLTIVSDDPDEPSLGLTVTAGERGPHLRFDPPLVDFGLVAGRMGPVDARLLNDGTVPLTVGDVVLATGGVEFSLDAGGAAGTMLAPGDSVAVHVSRAAPSIDGIGRVTAGADGVPPAYLELRGPPTAAVGPDIDGDPLMGVTLDGTPSFAPANAIGRWVWTVAEAPAGSRTAQQFSAGEAQVVRDMERCPAGQNVVPQPCFFPDEPGVYRFALQVVDVRPACPLAAVGATCGGDDECCSFSCSGTCDAPAGENVCGAPSGCAIASDNPAVQTVRAIPDQAVFVSLSWDGPADMDLHMVRDSASAQKAWTAIPDDAYWNNPNPDWGAADATNGMTCSGSSDCTAAPFTTCRGSLCVDTSDDPRLLIDVTTSFGPEAIGIKVPPPDTYHIGVHFFPDARTSPRRATLRFFVLGEERFPPGFGPGSPLSTILQRNQFWYAARIVVPPVLDDTTIEAVALGPGNPQSNADPGNYPPIP